MMSPPMTITPTTDTTPAALLARARTLRPLLTDRAAETEALRKPPPDVFHAADEAGFFRLLMPRRYGGIETDVATYTKIWIELARGDMSAAWCMCLMANHALQVGSWFPERAQDEIFGTDAGFRAPAVIFPLSEPARRTREGWELHGTVGYCSGAPYCTHYLGQATSEDGAPLVFVAPRSTFEVLDDWGDLIGLKGSGSNTIAFDGGVVPHHWVLENTLMTDVDVSAGTPGLRLHGNPMYSGRTACFFSITVACTMVGAALGALDEFERILRTRPTTRPPIRQRVEDPEFQRFFGTALGKIRAAEAGLVHAAELHVEHCRAAAEDGRPYTYADDMLVGVIAREAGAAAWEAMQTWIYRYAGSSASRDGERLQRIFRDMATGWGHFQTANDTFFQGELARAYLGIGPRHSRDT
jgi:3-hydroxy-9,10-secoandrosta-1,3,5(10)-triene-9,17-dione monooxygenase